jgi:pimeloyl-ACP methyl ester carboxylesterase
MSDVGESTVATYRLKDGRRLTFAQYGIVGGRPVVFFQGTPSSRLMHPPDHITREVGAHLIVVDRPGFGRSDSCPGRTFRDWPNDVAALLDHLGINDFVTTGVSGGGPYVLACAYYLGNRVRAASVCGSSGPLDAPGALKGAAPMRRIGYLLARFFPGMFRWTLRRTTDPRKDAEKFVRRFTSHNPPADQAIIAQQEFHEMYLANFVEAFRQGFDAFADEVILASRPSWGFRLEDIDVPVRIWHGDLDNSTPLAMARAIVERIPSSTLTVLPGQGHMFTYGPLWRLILNDLLTAGWKQPEQQTDTG